MNNGIEIRKSFWNKIYESRNKQCIFFVVSMLILGFLYNIVLSKIELLNSQKFNYGIDDNSWMFQIDDVYEDGKNLVFDGWAFEIGKNAVESNYDVILFDMETGEGNFLKMEYVKRNDIDDYFSCEYDYTESGFVGSIPKRKFNISDGTYEVLIRPEGKKTAYPTGIYFSNGEMMFVNPVEFIPLDVDGTVLEVVVKEGQLRLFRPDIDIYVYQYGNELYWIAGEKYDFVEDDTVIQYQLDTTQPENIPHEDLLNFDYRSDLRFGFKKCEIESWRTEKYRVAKCAIPQEYSVTFVWTGDYREGWLWLDSFRIYLQ